VHYMAAVGYCGAEDVVGLADAYRTMRDGEA